MTDAPEAGQAAAPAGEGQAQATWYDSAPDEVKGYIQNKGWDDPIKAVNSYQELEKFRGASEKELLRLPKDPNADGAYDEIFKRLGRPEAADKYTVDLGEGAQIDNERLSAYRDVAFKAGLSQKQFEALAKADHEIMGKYAETYNKERALKQEADYQALQKEWGAHASEREELSRRGLKAIIPQGMNAEETIRQIEDAIGTAATLKLFANVGEKFREDKVPDSSGDRPFGYTKEQALADKKSLMSELKADPARLANYNKGVGPDYDKMQRLMKVAV